MPGRVIILTEEESMKVCLEQLLPKIVPNALEKQHWIILPHQGWRHLQQSFPRKYKSWQERDARFLVMRDNDGADCRDMKQRLINLTPTNPKLPDPVIRIVCQELEGWFLGDLDAVRAAYPAAGRHSRYKTCAKRNPDDLTNASQLIEELTSTRAKVVRAREISNQMQPERNRSYSFQVFRQSVEVLLG